MQQQQNRTIIKQLGFTKLDEVMNRSSNYKLRKALYIVLIFFILFLFLPWTQNIKAPGIVTTLRPEQRPQEINSIIPGKIDRWFVKEGDVVKKGDTLLKLTEIKEDYLDPELLSRMDNQIKAKEHAIDNYRSKVIAIDKQLNALVEARLLKLQQLKNKVNQVGRYIQSDSMAYEAAKNLMKIATEQYKRQKQLYDQGLKSLTELEQRNQAVQDANSKLISAENKFVNAKNELIIVRIEMSSIDREYTEKISKAESERFQTLSSVSTGEGDVLKLENQFTNYNMRSGLHYITAPQGGQISKTIKTGIGEIVKDGELLLRIVPVSYDYAVEMFVEPMDLPLVNLNEKVMIQFDGWPAIFFSGWPNLTYGTFKGSIVAIDNNISENGKYRVLVAETKGHLWPKAVKAGSGAKCMALLKNVPIWYELWRDINGFPPDFYKPIAISKTDKKNDKK